MGGLTTGEQREAAEFVLTAADAEILLRGDQPKSGVILRMWRESQEWSEMQLATRLDISGSMVSRMESGERWIGGSKRDKLLLMILPDRQANKNKVDAQIASLDLDEVMRRARDAGKDELELRAAILEAAAPQVAITLGLCATGSLSWAGQITRSIQLFYEVLKDTQHELRLREQKQTKTLSKAGQEFLAGQRSPLQVKDAASIEVTPETGE